MRFATGNYNTAAGEMPQGTTASYIYLQALGKAVQSTLISLTREIIFGVFPPIILPIFFGLDGLLYPFLVADILTFAFAIFIIQRT